MTFLSQFSVILLDMNGTFMFGHDRFGPDEDYFATYQRVGEHQLDRGRVQQVITAAIGRILRSYSDPERVDDFPTLGEALRECGELEERDVLDLERVFTHHELGHVPPAHAEFLHKLARVHALGLVSNIWSPPGRWLSTFDDSGLLSLFKTIVFSSEGRSIKPSRLLFQRAMAAFPPGSATLFVGDDLQRDIIPAKALGLATAWIAPRGSADPAADVVVESLPMLADVVT